MDILKIDREHIWHPYASATNPPPAEIAVSGSGTRIKLADGAELIDAVSSWWCLAHGHSPAPIVEAMRAQAAKLPHVMFAGFTHEPAAELADALVRILPDGLNRVFYADSGSIAVEVAAKMAVQYQHAKGRLERCRLAALRGGYHGDTVGAMALSDPDGMHTLFRGMMPHHVFVDRPELRFGAEWDDSCFDNIAEQLERSSDEIAAVICEPVFQGANGMWMYHPGYLKLLRKFCTERDILLIFDEIASGFCRTGKFFAMDHAGVAPDIVCVGKSLTGGCISLAATVASEKVADTVSSDPLYNGALMHGPTYMANPVACAAGVASLRIFEKANYIPRVAAVERILKELLEPFRKIDNVADVRVLGAVGAIELKKIPTPERTHEVVRETGVWLRPYGKYVYTMPPFITTDSELRRITEAMGILANG